MGIYNPHIVYPPEADEPDLSACEHCTFDCDFFGYCIDEVE
ncbi:hypothetical protein [Methanobrevibacter sp.]